jgi:L-rhamnose mutarotase
VFLGLSIQLAQGRSTFPSSLTSVFPSFSSFSSNCEDRVATSNLYPCETLITSSNNNLNHTNSPVTVTREKDNDQTSSLILNEIQLSSNDLNQFNIHDYAIFVQPSLLPDSWGIKHQQSSMKLTTNNNTCNILWAKVRAVTYMTTLAHRSGSWYSDDPTETSPMDDVSSLSDNDEKDILPNIELNDLQDYNKPKHSIPLRRSLSSIDYVKHDEIYSPTLSRSHSTTLINSTDHLSNSLPIQLTPPSPPPPPPPPLPRSSSRVYRFLHCIIL